jgi:hypothetical protein
MATDPCCIALAWIAQKTPPTTALLLLCVYLVAMEACFQSHSQAVAFSTGFAVSL